MRAKLIKQRRSQYCNQNSQTYGTCNGFNPYFGLTLDVTTHALHISQKSAVGQISHRTVRQIRQAPCRNLQRTTQKRLNNYSKCCTTLRL